MSSVAEQGDQDGRGTGLVATADIASETIIAVIASAPLAKPSDLFGKGELGLAAFRNEFVAGKSVYRGDLKQLGRFVNDGAPAALIADLNRATTAIDVHQWAQRYAHYHWAHPANAVLSEVGGQGKGLFVCTVRAIKRGQPIFAKYGVLAWLEEKMITCEPAARVALLAYRLISTSASCQRAIATLVPGLSSQYPLLGMLHSLPCLIVPRQNAAGAVVVAKSRERAARKQLGDHPTPAVTARISQRWLEALGWGDERLDMAASEYLELRLATAGAFAQYDVKKGFIIPHECSLCELQAKNLQLCARCHLVRYCSKECQRQDWSKHREQCNKPESFDSLVML